LLGAVGPSADDPQAGDPLHPGLRVRLSAPASASAPSAVAEPHGNPLMPLRAPLPPRYFKSSELDAGPAPMQLAPLVYPEKELINRIRGVVQMRIYISDAGLVEKSEIVSASPAGRFEDAATEAIRATRFRPGVKDGRAVRSQKLVEVEFDPYGPRPDER
jgi:protein TonB